MVPKTARPYVKIPYKLPDYLAEFAGILILTGLILLSIYSFHRLPEKIPVHYNMHGLVDSYGSKMTIWILPVIGVILYAGLTLLNFYPHLINYPVQITEENAVKQYTLATRMIRILKVLMLTLFYYLNNRTIHIALQSTASLGHYFLPVSMGIILVVISVTIGMMIKR